MRNGHGLCAVELCLMCTLYVYLDMCGFASFRGGWDDFEKIQRPTLLGIDFLTRMILGSLGEEPSSGSLGGEPSPVTTTFSPLFRDQGDMLCFSLGDETCF